VFAIVAARAPQVQPFFFGFMIWLFVAMIGLHLHGAVTKAQPVTETYEIGLWIVLLVVTLAFYPG
jgi:hypothetical protein